MSLSITLSRSDVFPPGTLVEAYPWQSVKDGQKPSGTALASATVAANGTLTFPTLPEHTYVVLWAAVAGEARRLTIGDNKVSTIPRALAARIRRSRGLVRA